MKRGARVARANAPRSEGLPPVSPEIMPYRRALNAAEAARGYGVSDKTIYDWIKKGHLRATKIGGRVLIARKDYEALLPEQCEGDCPCTCHKAA